MNWRGPTPCSEWTVRHLIDHLVGGTENLLAWAAARKPEPVIGATRTGLRVGVEREALRQPGVMGRIHRAPLNDDWPVATLVAGTSLDVLIHTWVLARATGQDDRPDPGLVEACAAMFPPDIPERGRQIATIGPEVVVADDASPQDRLPAALGRTLERTGARTPLDLRDPDTSG